MNTILTWYTGPINPKRTAAAQTVNFIASMAPVFNNLNVGYLFDDWDLSSPSV